MSAEFTMQSVTQLCDDLVIVSVRRDGPSERELSEAEREVVQLILRGLSNKAVANVRNCSSNTVANQLASVYRKLSISGRRELLVKATRS
jgi:DNA-binding CsgD family transcriptional regulator